MNTDSPVQPARRRRLYIGGLALAGLAAVVGLSFFLNRSDGASDGRSETKNATIGGGTRAPQRTTIQEFLTGIGSSSKTAKKVSLDSGIEFDTITAQRNSDGVVTGTGTVVLGGSSFKLGVNVSITDVNNWTLTVNSSVSTVFTPIAGLSINPNTITGRVSKTNGTTTWALNGSTATWNITSNAVLTASFSISNSCPLADAQKCPSGQLNAVYLGMPSARLSIAGVSNSLSMAGGLDLNGRWSRLEGVTGPLTLDRATIANPQIVLWKGPRSDSFDPSMTMPDLSSLNNGVNVEFCGSFSLTIPKITNLGTNGCARWSKDGAVIAQSMGSTTVSANMNTTDANGNTLAVPASANVRGVAWTNLANAANFQIAFGGVSTPLETGTFTLAGRASLPGVVASALGIDLRGAQSLVFDVRGSANVSARSISISGDIPINLSLGTEPFKLNARSIRATFSAVGPTDMSISIGTTSTITLGYAPQTRQIDSSLSLVAATRPSTGMALSLSATGTKAPEDSGVTGLTASSKLTRPDLASYIWPDQFGLRGLNLFAITGEIGWTNGSPVVSYRSTTYLDPNGEDMQSVVSCRLFCQPDDWMIGNLAVSASYTNPCFAYGFDAAGGSASFEINDGIVRVRAVKIGVAPNGCSITTNGTTESLPKGFFGFMFNMQFGDTTLNVATQVSDEGFVFDAEIDNLTLAGITYTQVALKIEIDESGSAVSFSGAMDSDLGSAAIDWFVTNDSYNGRRQFLSGSVTNWKAARAGTFEVPSFSFSATSRFGGNNACSSFSASAQGQLKLQAKTYTLKRASFELTCEGLQNLDLAVDMEHEMNGGGTAVAEFRVSYLNDKYLGKSLIAGASFEYTKYNSWEYLSRTFGRHIDISINVGIMVQYANTASAEFTFGGGFDADRVGGSLDCEWTSSGQDFRCSGKVKVNPEWADKYVESWGDL